MTDAAQLVALAAYDADCGDIDGVLETCIQVNAEGETR